MNKKLPGALTVRPILDKKTFYLLSFTWGLPMTLAGLAMAIGMLLTGHRMHRFGPCFYFERGKNWGGMTWGFVIVVCEGAAKASVRLDILRAVYSYTGFGSDKVTILEFAHGA